MGHRERIELVAPLELVGRPARMVVGAAEQEDHPETMPPGRERVSPAGAKQPTVSTTGRPWLPINSNRSDTLKKFLIVTILVLSALSVGSSAAQASTIGQREALGAAKSYLSTGSFSQAGLIHQLQSPYGEDFSHSDSVWGVIHAHANWNAEAVEAAKSYLKSSHFSRAGLIQQLESPYGEQFTHAQAVYGVSIAYR